MRVSTRVAGVIVAVVMAVGFGVVPAHATVHEIVAQWCSGHDALAPPGLSREGSKNFARPLNATGVVIVNVDPIAETIHITFDYDHPAAKVQRFMTVQIGVDPDTGFAILLDLVQPDPDFPAFAHCPKLNS
jgi:hypothetical protein